MRSLFPRSRSLPRRTRTTRTRHMSLEPLEGRELLSTISIGDASVTEGNSSSRFIDAFVGPGSGLAQPRIAVFGPGGDLYVASFGSDQVLRYRADGSLVGAVVTSADGLGTTADGLGRPSSLAFGPDGKLYVSGCSHNILTYDPATGSVATFVAPGSGGLNLGLGLTFGPDGSLYASSRGYAATTPPDPDEVLRFEGPGGASPGAPRPAPGQTGAVFIPDADPSVFDNPNGMSFGPDGRLYVAFGSNSVNRYEAATGKLVDVFVQPNSGGLSGPNAIAFRPDGFLYITSQWNNLVLRYSAASGAFVDTVVPAGSGGIHKPLGIAFDPTGNLYVSSRDTSQMLRFGAASQTAFTVSLDAASVTTVTVDYTTAAGSALAGSDFTPASGTLTFAPGETTRTVLVPTLNDSLAESTETFTLNLSNPSGATIADGQGVGTIHDDDATKFYVVNDASSGDRTYEYGALGASVENYTLNTGNTAPRGAASTATGTTVWVADANKKVYVYNTSGGLLGSWTAGSLAANATVEGIATNGNDVWIVDAKNDKVFRYTNAASLRSGSQNAATSFSLNSGNAGPKDIVTDGTYLWVVNDSTADSVFKYTLSGSLIGSWTINGAGSSPTGITLDPTNVGNMWVVDSGTKRVYQFDNAAGVTSGSLSPSTSFALAAGNTNPQGIADPPPPTSGASQTVAFNKSSHPSGQLAAQHQRAFPGASKSIGASHPLTSVSPSIRGPEVKPIENPMTPWTGQDLTPGTAERLHSATKRPRISLPV